MAQRTEPMEAKDPPDIVEHEASAQELHAKSAAAGCDAETDVRLSHRQSPQLEKPARTLDPGSSRASGHDSVPRLDEIGPRPEGAEIGPKDSIRAHFAQVRNQYSV